MKTAIKVLCIISILFLTYCAMSSRLLYDITLDSVERPSNAEKRYGEPIITKIEEDGIGKYLFEDDMIKVTWVVTSSSLNFELYNKTSHSIKIIWDEAAYVDVTGQSQRIMHSGVKFIDRNNPQPPSVIIRKGTLTDIIIPTDNVYFNSRNFFVSINDPAFN